MDSLSIVKRLWERSSDTEARKQSSFVIALVMEEELCLIQTNYRQTSKP